LSETFTFEVGTRGSSDARVYRADDPMEATLILAHGAGAPQSHPFMTDIARRLSERGIDVVTFDFLYAAARRKLPDRNDVLEATWRAVIATVRARGGLPTESLFIGGKSMGGRIASQVAAADGGLVLSGLVFLGYPLHPAGKPHARRDAHLPRVPFPMLFVQGTRDDLGSAADIAKLALPNARVHAVEGGDHSLGLPKRDGKDAQERSLAAAASAIASFVQERRKA
jgi:predicted alpha/beta-hydrolase family hydrolase